MPGWLTIICLGIPASVIGAAVVGVIVVLWRRRHPPKPPGEDVPYTDLSPADLLDNLPSLGTQRVEHVVREETRGFLETPSTSKPVLIVGPMASGKTREAAEIALRIAAMEGRAWVYLMRRVEVPRDTPPHLREHVPILFFDDLDQPWRADRDGDVRKATEALGRIGEVAAWFAQRANEPRCWVLANARREPLERVCRDAECRALLAAFRRFDLGDMPQTMEAEYWRKVLKAFKRQAPPDVLNALGDANDGGFRLPYLFVESLAAQGGHKKLTTDDVAEFRRFQEARFRVQADQMSERQRELLQVMGDLASLGVPLFPEFVAGLTANRRTERFAGGRMRRWRERARCPAELRTLARQYMRAGADGRLLLHASRLPDPGAPVEALAPEVGRFLLGEASDPRLTAEGVARLREALAGMDEVLWGSGLLRVLEAITAARRALSLPPGAARLKGIAEASQIARREPAVLDEAAGMPWASAQNDLGVELWQLPVGDRAENLGRTIECYQAALRVHTEAALPADWAMTQNNLGNAYREVPTGDRAENLRRAIECYEAALRVRTEAAFPADWARTQNNLGAAYYDLPTGDRAENLRRAIECLEAALRVRTEAAFPADWATIQNNLGTAYWDLPTGDRPENLRRAIECYKAALRVYTKADFPAEWASTQNNLGNAYGDLLTGDRAENVRRAIECYKAALRVRTEAAFPAEWAMTENNLGTAYHDLPTGDRAENLCRAIECYQAALRVWKEAAYPADWAMTRYNMGLAYEDMAELSRREANLRQGETCLVDSLRVFTAEAFPEYHARAADALERVRAKLGATQGS